MLILKRKNDESIYLPEFDIELRLAVGKQATIGVSASRKLRVTRIETEYEEGRYIVRKTQQGSGFQIASLDLQFTLFSKTPQCKLAISAPNSLKIEPYVNENWLAKLHARKNQRKKRRTETERTQARLRYGLHAFVDARKRA